MMSFRDDSSEIIDARGLKCPLPILKLGRYLRSHPAWQSVELWADDPVSQKEIPLFCEEQGYSFDVSAEVAGWRWVIRKPTQAP